MTYNELAKRRSRIALSLMITTLVLSIVGSVFLVRHWEYISRVQEEGYAGLFVISLISGSPIPIPTASMIITFTMGSFLDPLAVGLISGLGNTTGGVIVYVAGRGGRRFFPSLDIPDPAIKAYSTRTERFLAKIMTPKMREFANRRAMISVFILSFVPNPILTPWIIGMGATRYPFRKFLFACWLGKTAQTMILAYLGYFGLRFLQRYLGIFGPP
jgi:membrane protein YqaA with SNARE-associated domain